LKIGEEIMAAATEDSLESQSLVSNPQDENTLAITAIIKQQRPDVRSYIFTNI